LRAEDRWAVCGESVNKTLDAPEHEATGEKAEMQTCRAGADLTSEPLGSLAVSPAAAINDKSEETSHGDGDVLMAAYSNAPSYHLFLAILTAWPCTSILQSLWPIVAEIVRKSLGPAQAWPHPRLLTPLFQSPTQHLSRSKTDYIHRKSAAQALGLERGPESVPA
jgi:hypothetical protein